MSPCQSRLSLAPLLPVTATCALVTIAACSHDNVIVDGMPPRPDFRLRTSPQNLPHNLKLAYMHRNLAEYEALLAEDFTLPRETQDDRIDPTRRRTR